LPSIDLDRLTRILAPADAPDASPAVKGQAFESAVRYLFEQIPGVSYRLQRALGLFKAEEVDLLFANLQRDDGLSRMDPELLVECKNWSSPVGAMEVNWFATKLRRRSRSFGVLVAARGITGDPDLRTAACQEVVLSLNEGQAVAILTREEISHLVSGEHLADLLNIKRDHLFAATDIYVATSDDLRASGSRFMAAPEESPKRAVPPDIVVIGESTEGITLQRDAAFGGGLLAWAEQRDSESELRVRARVGGSVEHWLTPPGEHEYTPVTDGTTTACYRQSGGVVIYQHGRRWLVSETGGPGDVRGDLVAAQGLGIRDGLGGGISLISVATGDVEVISDDGDSPRFAGDRLYWTVGFEVRRREISGGPVEVVAIEAAHAAVDGDVLAYSSRGDVIGTLRVVDLRSGENHEVDSGDFVDAREGRIAYLRRSNAADYEIVVIEWPSGRVLLRAATSSPLGGGPVLTHEGVVWESSLHTGTNRLIAHRL
jgi:hypothetical protein